MSGQALCDLGRLIAQQPSQIAYSLFDAKALKLFMPSVYPAIRADSIGELRQARARPDQGQATVARYNAAIAPARSTTRG